MQIRFEMRLIRELLFNLDEEVRTLNPLTFPIRSVVCLPLKCQGSWHLVVKGNFLSCYSCWGDTWSSLHLQLLSTKDVVIMIILDHLRTVSWYSSSSIQQPDFTPSLHSELFMSVSSSRVWGVLLHSGSCFTNNLGHPLDHYGRLSNLAHFKLLQGSWGSFDSHQSLK